uniref:Insulin n=1 Tax=Labrus bergylta TaxID=56723 RepID=A0A3Q3LIQ3_9LABR
MTLPRFRAADSSEDPFSSRQDESSEGVSHNFVVEGLLQGTRDLSITPRDNQEILEALRKADRKGRDVVVGLSNACCKWGCSKSEISSLC